MKFISHVIIFHYKMTSIVISSSTEVIEEAKFFGDEELETLTFEDGETPLIIEDEAFAFCEKLSKINFGNRKIKLGRACFECCPIVKLEIPPNVILGDRCFSDSYQLKELKVDTSIIPYSCFGFNVCGSVIESIYISDNVSEIGEQAFMGIDEISNIRLPDYPITIGENAFDVELEFTEPLRDFQQSWERTT